MGRLECEYLEICSSYDPKRCFYGKNCPYGLTIDNKVVPIRQLHKRITERYMADECLKGQIEEIVDE
jgi:hypothetical protein